LGEAFLQSIFLPRFQHAYDFEQGCWPVLAVTAAHKHLGIPPIERDLVFFRSSVVRACVDIIWE
jgi:hypothetical protein